MVLFSLHRSHSDNSTYITIELSQGDMFRIKSMQWLAVSDDTTYLTVDDVPPLTWSISKRPIDFFVRVVNIRNTNALPVTRFIPDTTRPYLSNYTIDVNAGTLVRHICSLLCCPLLSILVPHSLHALLAL